MTYLAVDALRSRSKEDWPWLPLRRLAKLRRERNRKSEAVLLALSSEDGVKPRPDDGGRQLPSEGTVADYWMVEPDDLVFNPMWAIGGGVAVSKVGGAVSTAYRIYAPGPRSYPRFLHYYMRCDPIIQQYNLVVRGLTTFDRSVTRDDIEGLPIPVPPLATQRAIADYLDTETARIDALIEKKRRMVELLEKRWRSAAQYRMSDLVSQFGSIQLRHLVRCLDGRRIPVSSEERGTRPGPFPYYGASGIVDSIDGYLFDETLVLLGEDGAQLGDPDYPIARVVDGKVWVNNHAHVLRPTAVDPEFLTFHLNTFDRVPFMSGGTREKITQDDMNRIPVPHLPKVDQAKEARRLGEIRERCNEMSSLLVRQLDLLAEHRQALITAAVTGALNIPGVAA